MIRFLFLLVFVVIAQANPLTLFNSMVPYSSDASSSHETPSQFVPFRLGESKRTSGSRTGNRTATSTVEASTIIVGLLMGMSLLLCLSTLYCAPFICSCLIVFFYFTYGCPCLGLMPPHKHRGKVLCPKRRNRPPVSGVKTRRSASYLKGAASHGVLGGRPKRLTPKESLANSNAASVSKAKASATKVSRSRRTSAIARKSLAVSKKFNANRSTSKVRAKSSANRVSCRTSKANQSTARNASGKGSTTKASTTRSRHGHN